MVTVQDIFELPYFTEHGIKSLSGVCGFSNEVTSVNVIQLFTFDQWMRGGEVLLVNGIGLHLEKSENISKIIRKAAAKNVAAIIFLKNHFLQSIPDEALQLSDQLSFPLFWIPEEPPFSECISVIYEYISRKKSEEINAEDLIRNLLLYDSDLDSTLLYRQLSHLGYCYEGVRVVVFKGCSLKNESLSEADWSHVYHSILNRMQDIYHTLPLHMVRSDRLVLFLPIESQSEAKEVLSNIIKDSATKYPQIYFKIGCGNYYKDLVDYRKSYQEACHCHKACENRETHLLFYEHLGLLRLCMDTSSPDAISQYIASCLGPLENYDKQNQSDLLHTLNVLIACDFNTTHAAQELYIHRNTMIQRVEKIEHILSCDINDADMRRELSVATYLNHYYDMQCEHLE